MKKSGIVLLIVLGCIIGWYIISSIMNREVLDAFETLNSNIEESNTTAEIKNDSLRDLLPKIYSNYSEKIDSLDIASTQLINYIEDLKSKLMESLDDPNDFEQMSQSSTLDVLFFNGDKTTEKGKEFLGEIAYYTRTVSGAFNNDFPELTVNMKRLFNTEDVQNRNGEKIEWLHYHFEGFPLIASAAKLTQMQADCKTMKQQFLTALLTTD